MESASVLANSPNEADASVILEVDNLHVHFEMARGTVRAVEGLTYKVRRGEILALVGESGCGKSVSSLAVMRLLAKPAGRVAKGRIKFDGKELLSLSEREMREIRGRDIGMVFQEPMTSLTPLLSIGLQLMEPMIDHLGMTKEDARKRAAELLGLVGLTDPERRLDQYPHHLSGGMRQRVMIAIALACNPKMIIADEPTTALDVTIQAQILELMRDLARRLNVAMIIITHNLGIVARYADTVSVMYAARLVEQAGAIDLFRQPLHPYTLGLLNSIPRLDQERRDRLATIEGSPPDLTRPPSGCRFASRCSFKIDQCEADPSLRVVNGRRTACWRAEELESGDLLIEQKPKSPDARDVASSTAIHVEVKQLRKHFNVSSHGWFKSAAVVRAVNGVNFHIRRGETLGLVGESGCGKSTVGRMLLGLDAPTTGTIGIGGAAIEGPRQRLSGEARRKTQAIFQDPFSSLNPRMTIGQIIAEPLQVYGLAPDRDSIERRVAELLTQVGLFSYMADRYPHELSGGQRQRVGIARALALNPEIIVCDEPVSALDVSIQGQIINLLDELQRILGLTYLFIAHDLAVVRHISHRVAVMYLGRIMELADRDDLYKNPRHPYTRALLDAVPVPNPEIEREREPRIIKGDLPSPMNLPSGCVFRTRCAMSSAECAETVPELRQIASGHFAACLKV